MRPIEVIEKGGGKHAWSVYIIINNFGSFNNV